MRQNVTVFCSKLHTLATFKLSPIAFSPFPLPSLPHHFFHHFSLFSLVSLGDVDLLHCPIPILAGLFDRDRAYPPPYSHHTHLHHAEAVKRRRVVAFGLVYGLLSSSRSMWGLDARFDREGRPGAVEREPSYWTCDWYRFGYHILLCWCNEKWQGGNNGQRSRYVLSLAKFTGPELMV